MPIPDPIRERDPGGPWVEVVDKATGEVLKNVIEASPSQGYVIIWEITPGENGHMPERQELAVETRLTAEAPAALREMWGL